MKTVTFSIREYCEVVALKTIMQWLGLQGVIDVQWRILIAPVNTDFNFCNLEQSFGQQRNVSVIKADQIQKKEVVFGFETDMKHDHDQLVTRFFNCSEIASCKMYRETPLRVNSEGVRTIVIGNVKVKCPIEEFQLDIFKTLAELPYRIVVVPRHPLTKDEMDRLVLPEGIDFRNSMGELEALYAAASLAVMGRLFCFEGLKPDDDHNPLEATVNGHAICGINNKIPEAYRWLYECSGLLHRCSTYEQVFDLIAPMLEDEDVDEKLFARQQWILANRQKYLMPIGETILSSFGV